jgi:hypothetical protein
MLKGVAAGLVGASAAGTAVTGTAAAGTTDGTASASENHIVLEADERPVEYRIEVSGQIVKAEGAGQTDSIVHDHVAVGTMLRTDEIDDAWDGFRYTGRIVRFDVFQGSFGRVWINGERVHPDDIGHPDPPKVTVLEDFEDRVWPGEWTDLVGEYQLTDDAIRGNWSLEATSTWSQIANSGVTTPRDHTYAARVMLPRASTNAWLSAHVQNPRLALSNCYSAVVAPQADEVRIVKRTNGSSTILDETSVALEYGTEYRVALDSGSDEVRARVFDAAGTQLGATAWVPETAYAGGHPGLYFGGVSNSDAVGGRWDDLTQHPFGGL